MGWIFLVLLLVVGWLVVRNGWYGKVLTMPVLAFFFIASWMMDKLIPDTEAAWKGPFGPRGNAPGND